MKKVITISGVVAHGRGVGRKLEFPTANIALSDTEILTVQQGLYLGLALVDGHEYWSLVNIGVRPTIAQGLTPLAEAYLLDFSGSLYGKHITLKLVRYLRGEKQFDSLDQLKLAMEEDKKNAIKIIKEVENASQIQ